MTARSLSVSGSFANGEIFVTFFATRPLLLLVMLTIELADPLLVRVLDGPLLRLPLSEPVEPLRACASRLLLGSEPRWPGLLIPVVRLAARFGFGESFKGVIRWVAAGSRALSKTRALMAALLTCHCGSRSIAPTASTSLAPCPTSPNACTAAHRTAGASSLSHFRQICCALRSPLGTSCWMACAHELRVSMSHCVRLWGSLFCKASATALPDSARLPPAAA
mmetsp:Transcript_73670/g.137679  ORF Transcript_73670/g.137679 Transcript_73670/m.137679 type:complete len:222 (+) Transcript_73670:1666-2331(+)